MTVEIKVPPLGESVSEATIAKWHKKPGEFVKADTLLVELETDKITMEINAPASGVISEIKSPEGSTVEIGAVVGLLDETATSGIEAKAEPSVQAQPAPTSSHVTSSNEHSPAVRKMVAENNINSADVQGTGKDGRITKGDVINFMENPVSKGSSSPITPEIKETCVIHAQSCGTSNRSEERVKMTRLRKRIAERLKESQNTAAILTTFNEIDMHNVMELRNKYKDHFEKKHGIKLGFMSFFVKAAIAALKEIPAVNASIEGDELVYRSFMDVGVAVGTEQGLVVPIIRNAETMSFAEIEKTIAAYGKKARDGKLSIDDLTGGTFTISNGGVYGSLMSTPIINPPQSGILGMHKTMDRPVAINGKVEIRPMMYVALSYDHRIIDGKEAVTFLVRIKECIENPERLLFDL